MHNFQLKDKNSIVKWKSLRIQVEKVLQEFSQPKEKIEDLLPPRRRQEHWRLTESIVKVSSQQLADLK